MKKNYFKFFVKGGQERKLYKEKNGLRPPYLIIESNNFPETFNRIDLSSTLSN